MRAIALISILLSACSGRAGDPIEAAPLEPPPSREALDTALEALAVSLQPPDDPPLVGLDAVEIDEDALALAAGDGGAAEALAPERAWLGWCAAAGCASR